MAAPTAQFIYVTMAATLGLPNTSNVSVGTFTAPTGWASSYGVKAPVNLAAETSDIAVDLAALFPGLASCTLIFVKDVTLVGLPFSVSSNATGTRTAIRASGVWVCTPNEIALPTLYFDNANDAIVSLEIGVIGS